MNKLSRQEKRAHGDIRHRERKQRLQNLLAAKSKKATPEPDSPTGLVIGVSQGLCTVHINGETRNIRCDFPVAPGDRVSVLHEKVSGVAPRSTILSRADPANPHRTRLIAANIDLLVIVAALHDPPFRPGLVDRYMVAAHRGGVRPVLCLNKSDLGDDPRTLELFEVPTVRCSTISGEGIDQLREILAGQLSVFAGHSGVGKSSLLNALAGEARARTGHVNEETGKGRHTTTSSRLYELPNGARIIDTPGIREFGLGPLSIPEIRAAFPELSDRGCRFRDCLHVNEPDCPVRDAAGPRYASWLRLLSEVGR